MAFRRGSVVTSPRAAHGRLSRPATMRTSGVRSRPVRRQTASAIAVPVVVSYLMMSGTPQLRKNGACPLQDPQSTCGAGDQPQAGLQARLRAAQSGLPVRRDPPPRSAGCSMPPNRNSVRRRAPPPGGRGDRGSGPSRDSPRGEATVEKIVASIISTSAAMHRQRTKLAQRVNRVASGIERRGIVADLRAARAVARQPQATAAVCLRVAVTRRDAARCRRGARPRRLRHASVHRPRPPRASGSALDRPRATRSSPRGERTIACGRPGQGLGWQGVRRPCSQL